ncbi:MAG: hypothetical protein LDLANPLL_01018 [Turneriella sp.]|nr:hypothetical protein [Turneriella sp.]
MRDCRLFKSTVYGIAVIRDFSKAGVDFFAIVLVFFTVVDFFFWGITLLTGGVMLFFYKRLQKKLFLTAYRACAPYIYLRTKAARLGLTTYTLVNCVNFSKNLRVLPSSK